MNTLVRTTISLPGDLYEDLRLQAFQQNTSFSGIIKKKLRGTKQKTGSLLSLAGKYRFGKKNPPAREEIYGSYLGLKVPAGY